MITFQERCANWRREKYPDSDIWMVLCKATEELGELHRAVIGEHEGREGRGDPVHEAAQVVLVIASLVGQYYPDRDVLAEAYHELCEKEAELYKEKNP